MGKIKALECLRKWVLHLDENMHLGSLTVNGRRGLLNIADAIEAELGECCMFLPVDADGVPIRVGDWLEYDYGDTCGKQRVNALIYTNRWDFEFDDDDPGDDTRDVADMGDFYKSHRHCKPRTVLDVLRDFLYDDMWEGEGEYKDIEEQVIAKYAKELRMVDE